jgi:hypothetical protein
MSEQIRRQRKDNGRGPLARGVAARGDDAGSLMQPALDEFYATLSSEQKARFNTLGQFAGP